MCRLFFAAHSILGHYFTCSGCAGRADFFEIIGLGEWCCTVCEAIVMKAALPFQNFSSPHLIQLIEHGVYEILL